MPDTYTVNDDGSYSVVSEDETLFINFTNQNPLTGNLWASIADVKSFVAANPNAWTPYSSLPTQEEQDAMTAFDNRMKRDHLLRESDWTQGNDSPLADEAKASWATYRTALRDLSIHENWPDLEDADWPTQPE